MSQITTFSLILASKTYQNHPHQGWRNNPNNIELILLRPLSHLLTYFSFNVDLTRAFIREKPPTTTDSAGPDYQESLTYSWLVICKKRSNFLIMLKWCHFARQISLPPPSLFLVNVQWYRVGLGKNSPKFHKYSSWIQSL